MFNALLNQMKAKQVTTEDTFFVQGNSLIAKLMTVLTLLYIFTLAILHK